MLVIVIFALTVTNVITTLMATRLMASVVAISVVEMLEAVTFRHQFNDKWAAFISCFSRFSSSLTDYPECFTSCISP